MVKQVEEKGQEGMWRCAGGVARAMLLAGCGDVDDQTDDEHGQTGTNWNPVDCFQRCRGRRDRRWGQAPSGVHDVLNREN
jgi:hypothetical protein